MADADGALPVDAGTVDAASVDAALDGAAPEALSGPAVAYVGEEACYATAFSADAFTSNVQGHFIEAVRKTGREWAAEKSKEEEGKGNPWMTKLMESYYAFQDGWQENGNGEEQTLTFNNNQEEDMDNDLFTQRMLEQLEPAHPECRHGSLAAWPNFDAPFQFVEMHPLRVV